MTSKTYRYRLPGQAQWKEVTCRSLKEARYIVRMEYNGYGPADRNLPAGTIVERKPSPSDVKMVPLNYVERHELMAAIDAATQASERHLMQLNDPLPADATVQARREAAMKEKLKARIITLSDVRARIERAG